MGSSSKSPEKSTLSSTATRIEWRQVVAESVDTKPSAKPSVSPVKEEPVEVRPVSPVTLKLTLSPRGQRRKGQVSSQVSARSEENSRIPVYVNSNGNWHSSVRLHLNGTPTEVRLCAMPTEPAPMPPGWKERKLKNGAMTTEDDCFSHTRSTTSGDAGTQTRKRPNEARPWDQASKDKSLSSTHSRTSSDDSKSSQETSTSSFEPDCLLKSVPHEPNSEFEKKLANVIRAIEPTGFQQEACRYVIQLLRKIALGHFSSDAYMATVSDPAFDGSCRVQPYGSFKQRTHIIGSDLDVVLLIPIGRNLDASRRRELYRQHLDSFARVLIMTGAFVFNQMIHAKVPVLKVWYRGIPLDITVASHNDCRTFHRDSIVAERTLMGPHYQSFIRLVKHWSKENGVNDAFNGYLNSTCWTFLCLCYLNLLGKKLETSALPYKALMEGFFHFLVALGEDTYAIDANSGSVALLNEPWCPDPLVIRDPLVDGANLACALQAHRWRQTVTLCQQCATASTEHMQYRN